MTQISDVANTLGNYSSQVQQASATASSVNVTAAADTTTAKTGTDTDSVAISPAYSVEISQEGSRLSSTMKSGSSDGQTSGREGAAPPPGGKPPTGAAPGKNAAKSASASNEDSSDSSSENLSQYSDAQLKEMVSNGKISQSDYSAEMSKREAKNKETEQAEAVGGINAKTMAV